MATAQQLTEEELDKKYGGGVKSSPSAQGGAAAGGGPSEAELNKKYGEAPSDNTQKTVLETNTPAIPKSYGFTGGNVFANIGRGVKELAGGVADMGKDVLFPPGKTEGDKLKYLGNKYIFDPADEQAKKAQTASSPWESIGHSVASALPIVGPWAAGLGEQAGTGDVGGALSRGATQVAAGELAGKVGPRLLPKVSARGVGERVGSLGTSGETPVLSAPPIGQDIRDVRAGVGKKIWQPPTPTRNVEGVDVPGKPAAGALTKKADLLAKAGGFVGGGAIGGALGMPGFGEFGGGVMGGAVAPSLMEHMFPEPKEWSAGRERENAFTDKATELEKRGKQQDLIDAKSARENRLVKAEDVRQQKAALKASQNPFANMRGSGDFYQPSSAQPTEMASGSPNGNPAALQASGWKGPKPTVAIPELGSPENPGWHSPLSKRMPKAKVATPELGSAENPGLHSNMPTGRGSMPKVEAELGSVDNPGFHSPLSSRMPKKPSAVAAPSLMASGKGWEEPQSSVAAPTVGADADVMRLPVPRDAGPGINPNYAASIPRGELTEMSKRGVAGAGHHMQQLGKKVIYMPEEILGGKKDKIEFDKDGNVRRTEK
jgi:hypothetical protein